MSTLPLLIIDDERNIRLLLQAALSEYGFDATAVESCAEADLRLATGDYAGLIVDYHMPNEDGLSFLRRRQAAGCTIPAVVISGRDPLDVQAAARDVSVAACLPKPFELPALIATVRRVFGSAEPVAAG